ncbi:hypothetical protein [Stratiformator vulcanicus]|uniref:SGNH hydrolase-type esterase domain-containing protein n=1 Tax=Stratiformator vulcanicus TaxID=2527980 RepID=A0A517R240_9PLAN|nr:hypothetical protein [Stratiformator vulcanicus]QDT37913.1 hypothetical protein Pan189_22960 [Stratiformator vulcanicus]
MSRVAIFGASNVALGLNTICRLLSVESPSIEHLLVACGHGRAYGRASTVGPRTLGSLSASAIWDQLEEQPAGSGSLAVLTDIGNDALYGDSFDEMLDHVTRCIDRLNPMFDHVVVTQMPLESIRRLSPWGYHTVSRLFFPAVPPRPYETIFDELQEAAAKLEDIARQHGALLIEQPPTWYGLDPIHIRRSMRKTAWRTILQLDPTKQGHSESEHPAGDGKTKESINGFRNSVPVTMPFWRRWPDRVGVLGYTLKTAQPVVRKDGFAISLY